MTLNEGLNLDRKINKLESTLKTIKEKNATFKPQNDEQGRIKGEIRTKVLPLLNDIPVIRAINNMSDEELANNNMKRADAKRKLKKIIKDYNDFSRYSSRAEVKSTFREMLPAFVVGALMELIAAPATALIGPAGQLVGAIGASPAISALYKRGAAMDNADELKRKGFKRTKNSKTFFTEEVKESYFDY